MNILNNRSAVTKSSKRRSLVEPLEQRMLLTAIAMYFDPGYVNTAAGSDSNDLLQQIQSAGGNTVNTFSGTDAATFTTALSGAKVLLIPALDEGDLNAAMPNTTKAVIQNFVTNGGGVLVAGDPSLRDTALLQNLFGYSQISGPYNYASQSYNISNSTAATGTAFSHGPQYLGLNNVNSNEYDLNTTTLPSTAKLIYHQYVPFSDDTAVALLPGTVAGTFPVAYLAWSWEDGGPNGAQDSGWNAALNLAIDQLAGKSNPVSLVLSDPAAQHTGIGQSASFSLGTLSEQYATAPYTIHVNWGDGTQETTISMAAAGTIPSQAHTYAASGGDTVTITAGDSDANVSNTASFLVTVDSAPTVSVAPAATQSVLVGTLQPFSLGSFTASHTTGPYAVDVKWGDGTADTTFSTAGAGSLGSQSHRYNAAGQDGVSVTVTDSSGSVSGSASFAVNVTTGTTPSAITLASPGVTLAFGTPVTLSATVSPSAATGSVTFFQNGSVLGSANLSAGVATLTTSLLAVGSDMLSARYNGSATYAVSTSTSAAVTVTPPANTTSLSLGSATESVLTTQSETFTATVAPAFSGTLQASGTVRFYVDGTVLGTAPVQPGGAATLVTTAPLPVGSDGVYASYSGDANFSSSVSATISVDVTQAGTATGLTVSTPAATVNQPVVLTATVVPAAPATNALSGMEATGTVTFTQNGVPIGSVALDANGTASLATSGPLPLGVDSFAALYNGDANVIAGTSNAANVSVTPNALVPSVMRAVIPPAVVAGASLHGSLTASIINDFTGIEAGIFSVQLIASPTPSLGLGDTVVTTLRHNARIKVGKTVRVGVTLTSLPAGLAGGSYYLLLEVTDSAGRAQIISIGSPVQVAAATIVLAAPFASLPANVARSGAVLALTDTGNTNDVSKFTLTIGLSTDAAGQNIVATAPIAVHTGRLTVRVNKITRLHVTGWKTLLATVPAGSYYLFVTLTDASGHTAFAVSPAMV